MGWRASDALRRLARRDWSRAVGVRRTHATQALASGESLRMRVAPAFGGEARPGAQPPVDAGEQAAILRALSAETPSISCVYLYDALGSELFEQICETPEYYLTRVEGSLLRDITAQLVPFADEPPPERAAGGAALPPVAWVECSAGNGEKVAPLMLASAAVRPTTYVPLDVSASALAANLARFGGARGGEAHELRVRPIVGTNAHGLAEAARLSERKSFMLLGSSLGNALEPHAELGMIARHMAPRDRLLVGVDTPPASADASNAKSRADVVAAYNDARGVTAAFTLNALTHINRVGGTNFALADFAHRSEWCDERCAIVAHVEAVRDVVVSARLAIAPADAPPARVLELRKGERIFIEQSGKFSLRRMEAIAQRAGLRVTRHWLAPRDFYLVVECEPVL
ncbi:hypothetical protein KFE25_012542 [Diacronema lutheri]|uniref:Histidine-specific methyltransferase SAM-dependent domain-containing protein n=1 Tax=Diacronema lutheri TaxID=2081491 RepID=A0A8J5XL98_DIALT|nr:hypothetical protein KFE25_012542 [Diacronema lutheri]